MTTYQPPKVPGSVQVADDFGKAPNPYGDDGQAIPLPSPEPTKVQGPGLQPAGAPAPPPAGSAAPAPAPTAPGALPGGAKYASWADPNDPNALVQLPSGQLLPKSHPEYQAWAQQNGGGVPGAPAPGAPAPGTPAPAAPGVPNNTTTVLNNPVPGAGQPPPDTVTGAFQQALMAKLQQPMPDANNPAIKGAIDANRNAETRGQRQTQEALAERAAATGQTGLQETQLRRSIGESAGRQGAFAGGMTRDLAMQQSQELMQALMLGGNMLSDQDRMALQERLAQLDAQIRREGLQSQTQLGNRELDLRGSLGNRELDIRNSLGMGNLGLGWGGLLQNDSHFNKQLGANLGIEGARLNQSALLALLGGLG